MGKDIRALLEAFLSEFAEHSDWCAAWCPGREDHGAHRVAAKICTCGYDDRRAALMTALPEDVAREVGAVTLIPGADEETPPATHVYIRAADLLPLVLAALQDNLEYIALAGEATGRRRWRLIPACSHRIGGES